MSNMMYVPMSLPRSRATSDMPAARVRVEPARHEMLLFLALSYVTTWVIWLPLAMDPSRAAAESSWRPLYHLGFFGPLLAAMVVAPLFGGRRAVAALAAGLMPRSRQLGWIALGIVAPFAIWFFAVILAHAISGTPQPSLFHLGIWIDLPRFGTLQGWLFILGTAGAGAEVGWRGFALPRLQAGRGVVPATLVLTLAWAGWHIPLFFFDPNYSALGWSGGVVWFLALLGAGLVLSWLFNRSRGSTLACALAHGITTSIWMSWAVAAPIGSTMGALIVLLGLALAWRMAIAEQGRMAVMAAGQQPSGR